MCFAAVMGVAIVAAIVMVTEGHALPGRHCHHALKGHEERNEDGEQAGQLHGVNRFYYSR
jgi:hypothetical protein